MTLTRSVLLAIAIPVAGACLLLFLQLGIPLSRSAADPGRWIAALRDQRPVRRAEAARRLGEMGPKAAEAVPALVELLADDAVAEDLGEKIWNSLSLGGAGVGVDYEARRALVKIGQPSVRPLIAALKDTRPRLRWNAALTLGEIRDPQAVAPLAEALRDADPMVRTWAAKALGDIGDARALDPLLVAMKEDADVNVRQYAVTSLGSLRDRRAIEPLITALEDKDLGRWAATALFEITGQRLGDAPQDWKDWWAKNKGK